MEKIIVKNSIRKYVLLSILTLIFVAGGIFILFVGKDLEATIISWLSIIFFGFGQIVFLFQIFDSRPRIVIGDEGIFDRTLDIGVIEWQDIEDAYLNSVFGNDFISLVLKDNEKYLSRTSKIKAKVAKYNSVLGFETINVNLSGVNIKSDKIYQLIVNKIVQMKLSHQRM